MSQIQYSELESLLKDEEMVIGIDECGTGSLMGSAVVCGVLAPKNWSLTGLNDSKKLTEKARLNMRDKLFILNEKKDILYHSVEVGEKTIDKFGIAHALKSAYVDCIIELDKNKEHLIITDGILNFSDYNVSDYNIVSLIKADTMVPTVMAASILAKTYRDEEMKRLHKLYPVYNWRSNKGYGSREHINAIKKYGLSPLHRKSYKIKSLKELY